MAEEEPQSNAEPAAESTTTPTMPLQGLKKISPIYMKILAGSSWIWILIAFVVALAIIMAIVSRQLGDPTLDTTAKAGDINCASWSSAPAGYQDAITNAANEFKRVGDKVPIQPALLGAIYLSEQGNDWPIKDINSTDWAQGGNGFGPFQIENFENKWKTVSQLGLTSKIYPKPDGVADDSSKYASPLNFSDAALAAGGVLYSTARTSGIKIPVNTTNDNEIMCLAAGYNGGPDMCKKWKDSGYSSSDPPATTNKYHERALRSYKELSQGCISVGTIAGMLSIPFLRQGDPAWGDISKFDGGGNIFSSGRNIRQVGCGLTSGAMVARYLTGNQTTTPLDIANNMVANNCNGSGGTAAFSPSCFGYGISGKEVQLADIQANFSQNGKKQPAILRIKPNVCAKPQVGAYEGKHACGHYVVIIGIQGNNFVTNNPSGKAGDLYSMDLTKYAKGVRFFLFNR